MSERDLKAKQKLSIKETKYVAGRVKGLKKVEAYKQAGYKMTHLPSIRAETAKMNKKPHIQAAIDNALIKHGLSPEYAVGELGKIVAQDKEIGAKRLAIKDVLELHGWNKNERPTLQLNVNNAFFSNTRGQQKEIIEEKQDA